jgi:hypothetical protein
MPQPDVFNQPYLSPQLRSVIEPFEAELDRMDGEAITGARMVTQTVSIMQLSATARRQVQRMDSTIREPFDTPDKLDGWLQLDAAAQVVQDIGLKLITDNLARTTGCYQRVKPAAAEAAHELGREFIMFRARHAAAGVLRAANAIFFIYDESGQSEEVWERAVRLDSSHNLKSPPVLTGAWQEFIAVRDQVLELPDGSPQLSRVGAPSRLKVVNVFRLMRHVREQARGFDVTSTEGQLAMLRSFLTDQLAPQLSQQLDIDAGTISRVVGTTRLVMRYVRNAARVDPTIAEDPTARHAVFLVRRLAQGTAINSEQAAFKRLVAQTAKVSTHSPPVEAGVGQRNIEKPHPALPGR